MQQIRWYLHPVLIFIFSVIALGLSLFLYIYWYVEASTRLRRLIANFNLEPGQFLQLDTWVVIVILSILVGIIAVGIIIIFVFNVKTLRLYRLQHNFINNFTHELKTPVTSIQLYLETFRKYELPRPMQLKYIDYMLADVSRLTMNINRILNLARLESKVYEFKPVSVDLVSLTEKFIQKNSHLFQGCVITVDNPGGGQAFSYPVDQSLFEMLLMNLLTNAIKYNDAETPTVAVSFMPQAEHLAISFTDNGQGLTKRECKKIFKKFYRVERSGKPPSGSGLGLYFVESIVRIHQGRIKAESGGLGQGTAVTVTLPWANTNAPDSEKKGRRNEKAHPAH